VSMAHPLHVELAFVSSQMTHARRFEASCLST
jgi:hypothetical protein